MNVLNYKQYDEGNINPEYASFLMENKKALGVPDWMNYVDDNQQMYEDFAEDLSISFKRELENVLNMGLQTMIYNGQNDFIVNTAGVLTYLNTLEWNYAKQWKDTTKKQWMEYGGENLGWSKTYRNLAFVQVRNAGHLLPSDQPRSAWAMLDNFFLNNW
jgi:carboxypeptidase C (cathepsin A)